MARRAVECVVDDCDRKAAHLVFCGMHIKRLRRNGFTRAMRRDDRFFSHVEEAADGCWLYSPLQKTGYGQFVVAGERAYLAHRWSYEFLVGPIPEGLEIDHLCRNRACVNPWHLEPVTHRENSRRGVGSSETCVNGHPYDVDNTETHARGHRQCRTCRQNRERRVRVRAAA